MKKIELSILWIAILILIYTGSVLIGYQITGRMDWNINESAIMNEGGK